MDVLAKLDNRVTALENTNITVFQNLGYQNTTDTHQQKEISAIDLTDLGIEKNVTTD